MAAADVLDLDQVARDLGWSRAKVARCLAEAIAAGLLRVVDDDGATVSLIAVIPDDERHGPEGSS